MKVNRENRRIGKDVANLLHEAMKEKRLTCGLTAAVRQLELDPYKVAFCVLPQLTDGDRANHIHTVLLQAFCYERNIAIIQVENIEGLRYHTRAADCSCVVVLHPWEKGRDMCLEDHLLRRIHDFTSILQAQPIFKLPMK
ncbi:hypothetical protein LSTR_LSTR007492 [Laodelphax striatellus]|uniref:Ribosomal protein eL8/eL30/eS12/Gadd45 domain-containing protein n=1 Tax=Laodelphax striatellus TaxID=195883 RepID=A0A482X411_LAOST|nr:hypothetical protein LSTR_LSTR007492 [Laodelphax striatellus]